MQPGASDGATNGSHEQQQPQLSSIEKELQGFEEAINQQQQRQGSQCHRDTKPTALEKEDQRFLDEMMNSSGTPIRFAHLLPDAYPKTYFQSIDPVLHSGASFHPLDEVDAVGKDILRACHLMESEVGLKPDVDAFNDTMQTCLLQSARFMSKPEYWDSIRNVRDTFVRDGIHLAHAIGVMPPLAPLASRSDHQLSSGGTATPVADTPAATFTQSAEAPRLNVLDDTFLSSLGVASHPLHAAGVNDDCDGSNRSQSPNTPLTKTAAAPVESPPPQLCSNNSSGSVTPPAFGETLLSAEYSSPFNDSQQQQQKLSVDPSEPFTTIGPGSWLYHKRGVLLHQWTSAAAAKLFMKGWQRVWELLFDHRIEGIHAPVTSCYSIEGCTVTATALPPLVDGQKQPISAPDEDTVGPIMNLLAKELIAVLGLEGIQDTITLHFAADGGFYLMDVIEVLHETTLAPFVGSTAAAVSTPALGKARTKPARDSLSSDDEADSLSEASATGYGQLSTIAFRYELIQNRLDHSHGGTGNTKLPTDTYRKMDNAVYLFSVAIPQFVEDTVLEVRKLPISQQIVPMLLHHQWLVSRMHKAGINVGLAKLVLDRLALNKDSKATCKMIARALHCEMVARTVKHMAKLELTFGEGLFCPDHRRIHLVNRLAKNATSSMDFWVAHLLPCLRAKFQMPDSFKLVPSEVEMSHVLLTLSLSIGAEYEEDDARFVRFTAVGSVSAAFPDLTAIATMARRSVEGRPALAQTWRRALDLPQGPLRCAYIMRAARRSILTRSCYKSMDTVWDDELQQKMPISVVSPTNSPTKSARGGGSDDDDDEGIASPAIERPTVDPFLLQFCGVLLEQRVARDEGLAFAANVLDRIMTAAEGNLLSARHETDVVFYCHRSLQRAATLLGATPPPGQDGKTQQSKYNSLPYFAALEAHLALEWTDVTFSIAHTQALKEVEQHFKVLSKNEVQRYFNLASRIVDSLQNQGRINHAVRYAFRVCQAAFGVQKAESCTVVSGFAMTTYGLCKEHYGRDNVRACTLLFMSVLFSLQAATISEAQGERVAKIATCARKAVQQMIDHPDQNISKGPTLINLLYRSSLLLHNLGIHDVAVAAEGHVRSLGKPLTSALLIQRVGRAALDRHSIAARPRHFNADGTLTTEQPRDLSAGAGSSAMDTLPEPLPRNTEVFDIAYDTKGNPEDCSSPTGSLVLATTLSIITPSKVLLEDNEDESGYAAHRDDGISEELRDSYPSCGQGVGRTSTHITQTMTVG